MTDRLKQISLRKFRETVADLHEVVEVSKRDTDGNINILGYWTPYMTYPAGASTVPLEPLEDQPPVPGGTTAIRDGGYVREERAPGPPSPLIDKVPPTYEVVDGRPVLQGSVLDLIDDDEVDFPVGEDSEFDRHPRTMDKPVVPGQGIAGGVIKTPEEAAVAVAVNPVRAVPKPSQRKKR